mmetsp:Transcript_41145/g.60922  ORF Transcript_41145/g.60922 Transcript_41145/m.60922 type:complete len:91 (-) Transcript_41145:625-897(-)
MYQGKMIVCKHFNEKGSDAQAAYRELHVYHKTSFNANDRSGKLLKFLTTETLANWDGPTEKSARLSKTNPVRRTWVTSFPVHYCKVLLLL